MDYIIKHKLSLFHFSCDKNNIIYYYDLNRKLYRNNITLSKNGIYTVNYSDNKLYILTLSPDNELIYISKDEKLNKKFILTQLNEQIVVKKIDSFIFNNKIYIIFSAKYKDEFLLIYCILCDKSKPVVIDRIFNDYFYLYRNDIFYTNEKNILIHRKLNEREEDLYKAINDNVYYPYYNIIDNKDCLLYSNKNSIFLNHKPIINANKVSIPIIV